MLLGINLSQFKLFRNAEKQSLNIQMKIAERKRNRLTKKISPKLRYLRTNPACLVGVCTSAPKSEQNAVL
jgi:hypothetical protein